MSWRDNHVIRVTIPKMEDMEALTLNLPLKNQLGRDWAMQNTAASNSTLFVNSNVI